MSDKTLRAEGSQRKKSHGYAYRAPYVLVRTGELKGGTKYRVVISQGNDDQIRLYEDEARAIANYILENLDGT